VKRRSFPDSDVSRFTYHEQRGRPDRRKPMRIAISSQVDAKTRVKIDRLQTLC